MQGQEIREISQVGTEIDKAEMMYDTGKFWALNERVTDGVMDNKTGEGSSFIH